MRPLVTAFFDLPTQSYSYVIAEPGSRTCAVIDPVLDFDPDSGATSTAGADRIVDYVKANDLIVEWLLETHVHADHLSAARYLSTRFVCAQIGIARTVTEVQAAFADRVPHEAGSVVPTDGRQFDRLLDDGDRICLGHVCGRVLATPGHTPACVSFQFDDLVIVGDTLFMPDYGTARCDFPGGDAATLYHSIQRLLSEPPETRLLMCHDYAPGGRSHQYLTTVAEQRAHNIHIHQGVTEEEFVSFRSSRDKTLSAPALMPVAVPYNLTGGLLGTDKLLSLREQLVA